MWWSVASAVLLVGVGLASLSCSSDATLAPLRVGYAVEAPYAFVAHGEVVGESPLVARHVAAALGRTIEWRQLEFAELLDALEDERIDVIAAGMFVTPERAARFAFSDPTCHVSPALLVARGNPEALHSYEDVLTHGARIAVLGGSIEETILDAMGVPAARLVRVPDAMSGRVALEVGAVDALALTSPSLRRMDAAALGAIEVATPFTPPTEDVAGPLGYCAEVFRRSDGALVERWNAELARYVGSTDHRAALAALGFTDAEIPVGVRTAALLEGFR